MFGTVWQRLRGVDAAQAAPQGWEIAAQFGRNVIVALALAMLLRRLAITGRRATLRVGVLVWLGFQATTTLIMAFVLGRTAAA